MKRMLRGGIATARMCLMEKSYFGLADVAAQYLLRAAALGLEG